MQNPLLMLRMARAAFRLVRDPNRLDEVIAIADDLGGTAAFTAIVAHVESSPAGRAALANRSRVTVDLPHLRTLPVGSFGREAARFLDQRKLDPASLPRRPDSDGPSWLRAHLLESHDLWHVVTGFDTDVAGEGGLQAFYLAQFPARLGAVLLSLIMMNTFIYEFGDRDRRMDAISRGWQLGRDAQQLLGVDWGALWTVPLAEVRARLGVTAPIDLVCAA
jgi:ubiquinone biosynthesis protein COQ4